MGFGNEGTGIDSAEEMDINQLLWIPRSREEDLEQRRREFYVPDLVWGRVFPNAGIRARIKSKGMVRQTVHCGLFLAWSIFFMFEVNSNIPMLVWLIRLRILWWQDLSLLAFSRWKGLL
nr:hypothetical protein Iba_chr04dCG10350 [Ipomoea batatas]